MKIGNEALRAKLAKSVAVTPRKIGRTIAGPGAQRAKAGAATPGRIARPISFTMNDGDLARIDAVRDFMHTHGARISASQAVKLALRAVKPGNDLVKLYEGVKADDGRRQ